MSATNNEELLGQIIALTRQYALRKWGCVPIYLKMTLPDGREQCEVMPAFPVTEAPSSFTVGQQFTRKQAMVVEALRRANGAEVSEAELLKAAGSDCSRLRDLFKRHPAWGTLIVPGDEPKTFRLVEADEDENTP